ncbi:MAG: hypothetical protein K1X57_10285 [Gemmataceae bacterium]|nr:hypothetical protein [Gemmataceae bacterium]
MLLRSREPRRGIILVVVVSMLALFAVIGLGYVIYSESAATSSRISRETQVVIDDRAVIEPELALNQALGTLIYDKPDDATGVYCALRGHSLARSMYGWNPPANTLNVNSNQVPYNGTGRLKYTDLFSNLPSEQIINFTTFPGDQVIRSPEKYPIDPTNASSYARPGSDPTRYFGGYNVPYTYPDLNNVFLAAVRATDGQVLIPSFHRPYLFRQGGNANQPVDYSFLTNSTHPDWYRPSGRLKLLRPRPVDQLTAAQVQAAGVPYPIQENITPGQINQLRNTIVALQAAGKLLQYPNDPGGDVKNLPGSPGGNDSVWVDIGLPVRTTRSGKKFKPMVAFLIRDLDGLININAAGNISGVNQSHVSNQGLGRHEISIEKLLGTEAKNLFQGNAAVKQPGRYTASATASYPLTTPANLLPSFLQPPTTPNGVNITPQAPRPANELTFGPTYLPVDVDAGRYDPSVGTGLFRSFAAQAYTFSNQVPLTLSSYPDLYTVPMRTPPIPSTGYDGDVAGERLNHPLLFNTMRPTGNSRLLDGKEMHRLQGRYSSPLDWQDSILSKLIPVTAQSAVARHAITLFSADLARPGLTPQTFRLDPTNPPNQYTIDTSNPNQTMPWAAQGEQFPPLSVVPAAGTPPQTMDSDFLGNPFYYFAPVATTASSPAGVKLPVTSPPSTSPILLHDGRSFMAGVRERIDLNRPLKQYPPVVANGSGKGQFFNTADPNFATQFTAAEQDRQAFCKDIFDVLVKATGVPAPSATLAPGTPDFLTLKYLAQLAVNIVDDIDEDDVMTVFRWTTESSVPPTEAFVYGVEMPKVVINEAYVEQTNGPQGDPMYVKPATMSMPPMALKYQVNTFVELHNTMTPPFLNEENGSQATLNYNAFVARHSQWLYNAPQTSPSYSAYRLYVAKATTVPEDSALVGDPPATAKGLDDQAVKYVLFADDPMSVKDHIKPVDTSVVSGPSGPCSYRCKTGVKNGGFFVIGPDQISNLVAPGWTFSTPGSTVESANMRFDVPAGQPVLPPIIVLQRLANPYIPEQPNPAGPAYNPYVAVDVMDLRSQTVPQALGVPTPPPGGANNNATFMRRQPFSGEKSLIRQSTAPDPSGSGPKNTFFSHNASTGSTAPTQLPEPGTGLERFDWYIHHDRKLTSPAELIHVAGVTPWFVTRRFMYEDVTNPGRIVRQGHTAAWTDEREIIDPMSGKFGKKIPLQDVSPTPTTPGNPPTLSARLYRTLEMFRTGDRTIEMGFGGRDVGKVNINTIWDKVVFDAVCDGVAKSVTVGSTPVYLPDAAYGFTQMDVDSAWIALTTNVNLTARTPNLNTLYTVSGLPMGTPPGIGLATSPSAFPGQPYTQIGEQDMPFWGMGAPHALQSPANAQYPIMPTGATAPAWQFVQNQGIEATLFRSLVPRVPNDPRFQRTKVFDAESQYLVTPAGSSSPLVPGVPTSVNPEPAVRHPFLEKSMITKIFEHFTTRSNVFAVYMTVGYFEVINDSSKPELLGDEIGVIRDSTGAVAENKTTRHRMFAIIDRTNLAFQSGSYDYTNSNNATIVGDDQMKQGESPFYYTSQVELWPSGPYAGAWTVTLPATSTSGNLPGGFVQSATGTCNGVGWRLQAVSNATTSASLLYVNTGSSEQRLAVRAIRPAGAGFVHVLLGNPPKQSPLNPSSWPSLGAAPLAPIRITNGIAGNPGPQPDFDHKLPNYRGVVLYSVILD